MAKNPPQKNTPELDWTYFHPRHWPVWLLIICWRLLVQLPYPMLSAIGKGIGRLLLLVGKTRRQITQRNLELCFPEKSPEERKQILIESFESAGMAFMEMGMVWWWSDSRLRKIVRVEGLEHIAQLNGQGGVLLGMHFTTLDMGAAGLSIYLDQPYGGMYRPHDNPVFNYVQYRGRTRVAAGKGLIAFPRDDLRTMVRLLRDGKLVWYAPDQDYGAQYGVFVPFFGVQAATITATSRLVEMGRAKVLPFTHDRLPNAAGYRITIHPPLEGYPTGDDVADATRINQVVEEHVRKNPGQYLWAHRRFKSRPPGVENRYPEIYSSRVARRLKRIEREQKILSQKGDHEAVANLQKKKEEWEKVQQEISRQHNQ